MGLGWLSASEFWERFSYYGMATMLVLYMVHQLQMPGHVEHVWGFAFFRSLVTHFYHTDTVKGIASGTYGFYGAFVYLTPIAGGIIAERFIGRTTAVTIGASLMALGHFLMTFDQTFLIALLCLLAGVGFFKGNIATQVGDLYGHEDPRRADGFQIYYIGIQIAVIFAPIACSYLANTYGWHWGFGLAGIGMLVGLTVYLRGRKTYPPDPLAQRKSGADGARAARWQRAACHRHSRPSRSRARCGKRRQSGNLQRLSALGRTHLQHDVPGHFRCPWSRSSRSTPS